MFSEKPDDTNLSYASPITRPMDNRWAVVFEDDGEAASYGGRWLRALPIGFHPGSPHDLMTQTALRRLRTIATPDHTVAVSTRAHGQLAEAILGIGGERLREPAERGSAARVFLAASYVLEYDPKATMLVHPMEYAAYPEDRLQGYLLRLCLLAELFHDQVVVLGATPLGDERDCSWVMPGGIKSPSMWVGAGPNPLGMVTYHDRPNGEEAQRLFREGALLNTGICAVKVKSLWKLGWAAMPETMRHFDGFRQVLHSIKNDGASPADEEAALGRLYSRIETIDMSRDVLQRTSDHLTVLPMDDVSWSDRRDRERMHEIMHRGLSRVGSPWDLAAQEL